MVCWVFNSSLGHMSFWLYTQVRGRVLYSISVGLLPPLFLASHQSSAWSEDCASADGCRSSPCSSPFSAHLHGRPCFSGLFFHIKMSACGLSTLMEISWPCQPPFLGVCVWSTLCAFHWALCWEHGTCFTLLAAHRSSQQLPHPSWRCLPPQPSHAQGVCGCFMLASPVKRCSLTPTLILLFQNTTWLVRGIYKVLAKCLCNECVNSGFRSNP